MTGYDLEILFEMMGVKLKRAGSSGNRSSECPLARWTHAKGQDKVPSLTAIEGEPGAFRCWACHHSGSVIKLAELFSDHSGNHRPLEFVRGLRGNHMWGRTHEYGANWKRIGQQIKEKIENEITEDKVKKFLQRVPRFAFDRGLTKEQVLKWEIGFDEKEDRMIFVVRDRIHRLVGVSGRDVTGYGKPKYKHYYGFKKETVLYGEKFLDRSTRTGYIVEGFMDVLALERHGLKNCFATMGTSLSSFQMQTIERFMSQVIFIPDSDDEGAGIQFVQNYGERLVMKGVKVGVAGVIENPDFYPREKNRNWEPFDYRFLPTEAIKGKDPADLSKEQLEQVLKEICWIELRPSSKVDPVFL